jgi:8-oxo-dGTP pyrophosphatase MutT (NUDIX family)
MIWGVSHPPETQIPPIGHVAQRLEAERCRSAPAAECERLVPSDLREAAVLLPLYRYGGRWRLLYIRRAEHEHDHHSGEVGFPGGRSEAGDADAVATALREAQEEIALPPAAVSVLGQMRTLSTVSRYLVTPVVGTLDWPQTLVPQPQEVARIFSIPLDWLRDPDHHRRRIWPAPDHPQAREVIFFDEYDGEQLWGITARITLDFLRCIGTAAR